MKKNHYNSFKIGSDCETCSRQQFREKNLFFACLEINNNINILCFSNIFMTMLVLCPGVEHHILLQGELQ